MSALQMSLFSPRRTLSKVAPSGPESRRAYTDPFYEYHRAVLETAGDNPIAFDEDTWDHDATGAVGVDVECYVNFFLICFLRFADGKRLAFERSPRRNFNPDAVLSILKHNTIVSFNGYSYDLPMIYKAIQHGADTVALKTVSDKIILSEVRPWDVEKTLGISVPKLNHIDLIDPNPAVRQGLKILQGRLHSRFLVDLPYPPEATLTPAQMNFATLYCFNDLDGNKVLYKALREPLELRVSLGRQYGIDLRSKSDSQVGEAIVKRRVESATGRLKRQPAIMQSEFNYDPPDFISFRSSRLTKVYDTLRNTKFFVSGGKIQTPPYLENLQVNLGDMTYSMGIGGLHSTESHRALKSDEHSFLMDVDVASQYPSIIVRLGLYPPALGPTFLKIYGELIKDRLTAKATGDKIRADGGRIALNGVYGKLGSVYSALFAPNLLIATTLTGQLSILMLIERAERAGIPVVSANTDGVVFRCPRVMENELNDLVKGWESDTGFMIERTKYAALYNSSVNTYIAVKNDGKVKRKGYISDPWKEGDLRGQMMKNPQMTICSEAIVRYLVDGISIEDTIYNCKDPRAFVTVVKVTGGAKWRNNHLGRAVRYYWALDGESILYIGSNKRVSKTEGSRPLLELTQELPPDVDHLRYVEETAALAADLGIEGL